MDRDRPGRCPLVLLPNTVLGGPGVLLSPAAEGVFSDKAGRWPRRCRGGFCETNDEFREAVGRVEECTGGSLRCRSPPGAKPFCRRTGDRSRPSGNATFLKVMVHSMSSPANTVAFFHCTNTRIFEADMVWGRAARAAGVRAAHRAGRAGNMTSAVHKRCRAGDRGN